MIYAIDFDGTIAVTNFPRIIRPVEATVRFIRSLQDSGDKWILWTMREGPVLEQALEWLNDRGLTPDAVNDNLPELKEKWGNNPRKVFADAYIDDRNCGGLELPEEDGDNLPVPEEAKGRSDLDERVCIDWVEKVKHDKHDN